MSWRIPFPWRQPMQNVQDPTPAGIGTLDFEVYGSGRGGRYRSSRFQLHCDAVGLHEDEMLLLSVVGAETSVKALTAGLRSSGRDQKRIDYSASVGPVNRMRLTRHADGYRIHRSKLNYGLWHVLCLAKREGFMPVFTEGSLWQLLQGDRYTTPLLKEWVPWLCDEMKRCGLLVELTQFGCQSGLVLADNDALDELVVHGIRHGHLRIGSKTHRAQQRVEDDGIQNLDDYMLTYGAMLGRQAERSLDPLHGALALGLWARLDEDGASYGRQDFFDRRVEEYAF